MKMSRLAPTAAVVTFITIAASAASADTLITGSIGRNWGERSSIDRIFTEGELDQGHTSYAASIGFMSAGVFGFEVEGTYSPDFLGQTNSGSSNVATLMGNIILGIPAGNILRIYVSGGGGLMKFRVPDVDQFFDLTRNDFGFDAGGGLILSVGGPVGVRGDVRYFRDVHERLNGDLSNIADEVDLGSFHYWRGSVGVTFKF